jgi:DNA mismatch repair protein PMS2
LHAVIGATCIDVRLRDFGAEGIEISDNGSGISPHDYDFVALKHYTSKLKTFDDLARVHSFGFRGEVWHCTAPFVSVLIVKYTIRHTIGSEFIVCSGEHVHYNSSSG